MNILGIETTCDETAAGIVRNGHVILSHSLFSSAQLQNIYGGVVPEIASRYHIEAIIPTISQCLTQASIDLPHVDLIAVAKGPGLIGSLLVGVQTAKALAWSLKRPLIGINHVEAHLYAAMMGVHDLTSYLPALGLIVSGGHTTLLQIHEIGSYTILGQTVDDAAGEAFDKVAKMLSLGYPGGPKVELQAKQGDPLSFPFKAGNLKDSPLSFSFSGLKTAVLYALQKLLPPSKQQIADLCASFQEAVCSNLSSKILYAMQIFRPKAIFCGGGVSRNECLRERFQREIPLPIFWPSPDLCTDNAAMIAGLAYYQWGQKPIDETFSLTPITRIR